MESDYLIKSREGMACKAEKNGNLVDNNSHLKFNKWISVSVVNLGKPHSIYTTIL